MPDGSAGFCLQDCPAISAFWEGTVYGIFKTDAGRKPVQLLFCAQRKPSYGGSGDAAQSDVFEPF